MDLCFVVVDVEGVEVDFEEELPDLLPQPATAKVLARTAKSVRIAVSDVRFMGRAPIVSEGLQGPAYQG